MIVMMRQLLITIVSRQSITGSILVKHCNTANIMRSNECNQEWQGAMPACVVSRLSFGWKMLWEKCINTISWNDCHIFHLHNSHYCIIGYERRENETNERKENRWQVLAGTADALAKRKIWEMHILFKRWPNTKSTYIKHSIDGKKNHVLNQDHGRISRMLHSRNFTNLFVMNNKLDSWYRHASCFKHNLIVF